MPMFAFFSQLCDVLCKRLTTSTQIGFWEKIYICIFLLFVDMYVESQVCGARVRLCSFAHGLACLCVEVWLCGVEKFLCFCFSIVIFMSFFSFFFLFFSFYLFFSCNCELETTDHASIVIVHSTRE